MPRIAPMVTTPVPPTPVTMMLKVLSMPGSCGSGRAAATPSAATRFGSAFLGFAPCTVTKDGQKPFTQEKSLLQFDWSIWRLRPNSVSTGCTATQFDCTEQSPQASQTRSLMMTRLSGSGNSPRLRRRRFSEAQVWS
jgi:hypothetical protein